MNSPHKCLVCHDCQRYVDALEAKDRELRKRIAKARRLLRDRYVTAPAVLAALAATRRKRK